MGNIYSYLFENDTEDLLDWNFLESNKSQFVAITIDDLNDKNVSNHNDNIIDSKWS